VLLFSEVVALAIVPVITLPLFTEDFYLLTPTDRFSKLMSTSVPSNLAHLYDGRMPTRPATAESLARDTREERQGGDGSTEDSDEDDYETMTPGVTAKEIEAWEERRKSFSVNSLASSRGQPKAQQGSTLSPIHYTRVIVPGSEQSAKPILAKCTVGSRSLSQSSFTPTFYNKQGNSGVAVKRVYIATWLS
jgi:hypothetical protein